MFYQDQHFGVSEYFCRETGENFSFPAHIHRSFECITVLKGEMTVTDVIATDGVGFDELLSVAYSVERMSEHPIGEAIFRYCDEKSAGALEVTGFAAISGSVSTLLCR